MSDDEILALQGYAVRHGENRLLYDTYTALGYGRAVGVLPLAGEVRRARERCAAASARLGTAIAE